MINITVISNMAVRVWNQNRQMTPGLPCFFNRFTKGNRVTFKSEANLGYQYLSWNILWCYLTTENCWLLSQRARS